MSGKSEPAFPVYPRNEGFAQREVVNATGMTLRDYFAAKAMASLATYEEYPPWRAAAKAYEYADAMLKARQENV
jgi:hypothetical protein